MDETRSVESMTNLTLEESMNTFIMQLNNALEDFDTSRYFRTVIRLGHLTAHDNFQGSVMRFDYGHFQMSTCSFIFLLHDKMVLWTETARSLVFIEIVFTIENNSATFGVPCSHLLIQLYVSL